MTTPHGHRPGPPQAMGRLLLHTAYNPMAFLLALTGPRVTINGQPANVRWGEVAFNLPAGNHHLRVTTRYLGDFGPAELPVAIYPGQVTTVYYRPPATKGMKGAIGFTPQPTRMASVIAINVVIVLAAIAVIVFTRLN